jgi:hypothetical protein
VSTEVSLVVYRRLDNRTENLPDDSPRAIELHEMRRRALHEVLDKVDGPRVVVNWGKTDDTNAHEWVQLVIDFAKWLAQPEQVHAMSHAAIINYCKSYSIIKIDYVSQEHGCRKGSS